MTRAQDAAEITEALLTGELHLSGRHLQEIPQFALACCGIQVLNLSANSLTRLPLEISELKSLTDLDLGFNQLRELPACVGSLTALTSLRAQYNQIELLHPGALIGLGGGCLVDLQLGDNALQSLPAEVGCLTRLTRLDLRYNRLSALPPELGRLAHSLQQLGLEGCPLGLGPGEGDEVGGAVRHAARDDEAPHGTAAVTSVSSSAAHGPQSQQRKALYKKLMEAAAESEACTATGQGSAAALAAALRQLELSGGTGSQGSKVTAPAAKGPGSASSAATGVNPVAKPGQTATTDHSKESSRAGAAVQPPTSGAETMVVHGGHSQGAAPKGATVGSGRGSRLGPRPAQLELLQLHPTEAAAARKQSTHAGDSCQPLSPLTDLRNSFADVELAAYLGDGASDGEDHGHHGNGINIVGPGSEPEVGTSSGPAVTATAVGIFTEELSELPPAAAAVLYRSLDMVAAGVQEMRDGRPLSRGGTSGFAAPGSAEGGPGRPGTSGSQPGALARPATQQHRRRAPTALAGGQPRTGVGTDAAQGHPSSSSSGRTGLGSSSGLAGKPGEGPGRAQELTGALALLASAGRAVESGRLHDPGRPPGGGAAAAAAGRGALDAGHLGSLAPITFPLAAGVRGMLRVVSGSGRGNSGGQPRPPQNVQGSGVAASTGAAAGSEGGPNKATWALGQAAASHGGELDPQQAATDAALDRLDVVRRVLAERNPELLRALDEQVFDSDTQE